MSLPTLRQRRTRLRLPPTAPASPLVLAVPQPVVVDDPVDVVAVIRDHERTRWRWGLMFVGIGVFTWIVLVSMVNAMVKGASYDNPFVVAYITGACFTLYLVPDVFRWCWGGKETTVETDDTLNQLVLVPLPPRRYAMLACEIGVIYYVYSTLGAMSLRYTTAGNQTILSTTSSLFTLVLGGLWGVEVFSWIKFAGICTSLLGIVMVTLGADTDGAPTATPLNPVLGNTLATAAALMYALYLIWMKIKIGKHEVVNERQLFGLVGVATVILCWPFVWWADWTGIAPFLLPLTLRLWLLVVVIGVLAVALDYSCILAMLLTLPLVVLLTLTTGVPLMMLSDLVFFDAPTGGVVYYSGVVLIFVAFVLVNLQDEDDTILQAIGEALDEALDHNEVMSPVFTPLLVSHQQHYHVLVGLLPRSVAISEASGEDQRFPQQRRESMRTNLFRRIRLYSDRWRQRPAKPSLEEPPLLGLPDSVLYAPQYGSEEAVGLTPTQSPQPPQSPRLTVVVLGGTNHRYTIRHVPSGLQ